MPFSWVDYLSLAERLLPGTDEADRRTAISRAYYAVFNLANAWLESRRPLPLTVGGRHEQVWAEFNKGSAAAQQVARNGERLKQRRVKADYRVPYEGDLAFEAATAVTLSRKVSRAIETLTHGDVP